MKPQETHKEIITACCDIINSWKNADDIDTSSRWDEIRPKLYAILGDNKFDVIYMRRLDEALTNLSFLIEKADRYKTQIENN